MVWLTRLAFKIHQIRLVAEVEGYAVIVVFSSGLWRGVAQKLLHDIQRNSLLPHIGSVGMAQAVQRIVVG